MAASDTTDTFSDRFQTAVAREPFAGRRVVVALSGGLDSTLLLHAFRRANVAAPLVAMHVDHGLHADSADWSAHCAELADSLGVALTTRKLELEPQPGQSVEAVAREARYRVFAESLGPGDVLVTAHHADDQLETVLLRMLRGTGVRGLTAIHALGRLGDGWLARPLLPFTRAELEAEARRRGLRWLEDPTNVDTRFDRNFLRADVLPALRERWPKAGVMASRLALQMTEAETVLDEIAAADLGAAESLDRIPLALLTSLSDSRLNNALRHAVRGAGLPVPSRAQLAELRQALAAREDASVLVSWPGAEARIFRQTLYLGLPRAEAPPPAGRIDADSTYSFAEGELRLVVAEDYGIPDRWARDGLEVGFRQGGERFRPEGSAQHKTLKKWCQERGIVPWMRGLLPLLFHDDELIAVADLCLASDVP
ncbi:MAG TPA: tRNA lysidine(34) synthetase TilS, partial [Gammaproteobacteria bacterium]